MNTIKYSGLRQYVDEVVFRHFTNNDMGLSAVLHCLLHPNGDEIIDATQVVGQKMRKYAINKFKLKDFPYLTNCMAYQYEEGGPYSVRLCLPLNATEFLNVTLAAIDQSSLTVTMSWPDGQLFDIANLLTHLVFECGMGDHSVYIDNEYERVSIKHLAAYAMNEYVGVETLGFLDHAKEAMSDIVEGNYVADI